MSPAVVYGYKLLRIANKPPPSEDVRVVTNDMRLPYM